MSLKHSCATGKWTQSGVPHLGWTCTGVEDLEEPAATCEMCEVMSIRYVHYMTHPDYPDELGVGCICSGHMEGDYEVAREREKGLRSRAGRREKWLFRNWRRSAKGNEYLRANGYVITIHAREGHFAFGVFKQENKHFSKRSYPTAEAAKLAAFDALCPRRVKQQPHLERRT